MFNLYLNDGDHILLVDGVEVVGIEQCKVDHCKASNVAHVGGGIYDAIIFSAMPPEELIWEAIEKVYWGGHVIVLGVEDAVEDAGYQVVKGDPGLLVLKRPPLPDNWTEEYFLAMKGGGDVWNPETKAMHQRYRDKFAAIDVEWEGKVVVEYGCGRGEITRLIAEAGVEKVYAIDNAPAAISMTKRFCNDLANVSVVCDDAMLWRSPQQADVIVALDFVEHICEEDLEGMFEQWFDNLREGGLVHIVTPLGPDAVRDHKWAPTPKKLREKMEKVGFKYKKHVRPEGSRKFFAEFSKSENG